MVGREVSAIAFGGANFQSYEKEEVRAIPIVDDSGLLGVDYPEKFALSKVHRGRIMMPAVDPDVFSC